ncbi:hypothetical protein BABINDRAFT_160765 [Babjeviella inositovora NRRL Y-12698]|uniref:Calcineurin-like phosphoesterase domain-containing protein n=1 Tax=Babjeviella inositovora NRRL Y-12698 TaxID=984486 RepID=A0A1E3QS11_9ASCO|nr:uncharacterized protein BABINDRAFT_160765 [Babjeviella inositovora NRRL Y-12698]ODQ80485.1 hypothetical protein BABINDRAFT_160765 [Babjeviella inositovora NRRL Y-12698]
MLSLTRPDLVSQVFTQWCLETSGSPVHCQAKYGSEELEGSNLGTDFTRLLQLMHPGGYDGDYYCYYHDKKCNIFPSTPDIDLSSWFPPKRRSLMSTIKPQGKTFNVLHISNMNLQVDYMLGSESNCTGRICCDSSSQNLDQPPENYNYFDCNDPSKGLSFYASSYRSGKFSKGPYLDLHKIYERNRKVWLPAHEFGAYRCDSSEILINNTLQAIQNFHQNHLNFEFAILTGGLVDDLEPASCNAEKVAKAETRALQYYKHYLKDVPLVLALGHHDIYPYGQLAQWDSGRSDINENTFDYLADLVYDHGWLGMTEKRKLKANYFGYSTTTTRGLKVISLNSNIWYTQNVYAFWNTTSIDMYGQFKFLVDELVACEKTNQRAWIIASIPTNQDALPIPSKVFRMIVERFSPATITGIFLGHSHRDEFQVLYAGDGSDAKSVEKAVNFAWIGPSISPAGGVNPSWRYYSVDTETFQVMNSYNFLTKLDETFRNEGEEPIWEFEYSAREIYDALNEWGEDQPLNAEFWHHVAEKIKNNSDGEEGIFQRFVDFQYRSSPYTPICNEIKGGRQETYCEVSSFTVDQRRECLGLVEEY